MCSFGPRGLKIEKPEITREIRKLEVTENSKFGGNPLLIGGMVKFEAKSKCYESPTGVYEKTSLILVTRAFETS